MEPKPVERGPSRLSRVLSFGGLLLRFTFWVIFGLLRGFGRVCWWLRVQYPFIAGFLACAVIGLVLVGTPTMAKKGDEVIAWVQSLVPSAPGGLIGKLKGDYAVANGCNADCQVKIATRRATIVPIEGNEVEYVRKRLREEYANPASPIWQTDRIRTCMENWPFYERAQEYTMIPAAFLAGKAYVESGGCRFVDATNGDGGKGPMQITTPSKWHEEAVGAMLHEPRSFVRKGWKGQLDDPNMNYWVNVLMGAVMLSGFEEQFNSRGVGILAYNAGPGNVASYMRAAGVAGCYGDVPHSCDNYQISQFRGTIPEITRTKAKPRIYVDRILAGVVMVDRAHRGLPVTDGSWIDGLTLADIPGANPQRDSIR